MTITVESNRWSVTIKNICRFFHYVRPTNILSLRVKHVTELTEGKMSRVEPFRL